MFGFHPVAKLANVKGLPGGSGGDLFAWVDLQFTRACRWPAAGRVAGVSGVYSSCELGTLAPNDGTETFCRFVVVI